MDWVYVTQIFYGFETAIVHLMHCKAQIKAQVKAQTKSQNNAADDREYLLLLIRENPSITQTELAELMNRSRRSVQSMMKKLIENGTVERIGSKKQGTWIVK